MSQDPVIVNNNLVLPGTAVVNAESKPEPPKSENPPAVEQSAKILLNVIALIFLFLSFQALFVAFDGTEDRAYRGLLLVWHHVDHHYQYGSEVRNKFLWFTGAILPASCAFVIFLVSALAEKKTLACGLALILLLMGLYFMVIPHFVSNNPASRILEAVSYRSESLQYELVIAWRYLMYSGGSLGVSVKIWSSM